MSENGQSNVLDFFNKHGKEGASAVEDSFNNANSQQRVNLAYSGRYRMKVATFGYMKGNKFKAFPNIYESSKKKALMLSVSLLVVDGTDLVPKGASMFHNITLAPAAGAKPETIEAIARMSKPQLVALYGNDSVKANAQWLIDNCLPVFDVDKDECKLVKDHNLKAEVMVEVVDDYYNNKESLKVISIFPASPSEKSTTNRPKELSEFDLNQDDSDGVVISDDEAETIADAAISDDKITIADVEPIKADDGAQGGNINSETSDF